MSKTTIDRQRRMGFIQSILEREKMAQLDVLIAQLMLNFGISKRDAKDEIEAVVLILNFKKEGNLIFSNEKDQ